MPNSGSGDETTPTPSPPQEVDARMDTPQLNQDGKFKADGQRDRTLNMMQEELNQNTEREDFD
jgi:hypothetical protein